MAEEGIDIAERACRSSSPTDAVRSRRRRHHHGLRRRLPVSIPGKRYEDWELDDPAGQPVETVRRIRDDIQARVRTLLREMTSEG